MKILLIISMLATLLVLILGIVSMACGGKWNEKYGNKLMYLRVTLQGFVIVLLFMAYASAP